MYLKPNRLIRNSDLMKYKNNNSVNFKKLIFIILVEHISNIVISHRRYMYNNMWVVKSVNNFKIYFIQSVLKCLPTYFFHNFCSLNCCSNITSFCL